MVRFASVAALSALLGLSMATPLVRQLVEPTPVIDAVVATPFPSFSAWPSRTPGASAIPRITRVPGRTPGASAPPSADPSTSPAPPSPSPSGVIAPSTSVAPTPAVGTILEPPITEPSAPPAAVTPVAPVVAPATPAAATPAGPTPAGPTPAGPTPAGPTPAGATPAAATSAAAAGTPTAPNPGAGSVSGANVEVSPSPEVTPSPESGANTTTEGAAAAVCFPAHATVELEDGSFKTMEQVELGDRVKVAAGKFSDVFMFTHKLANVDHEFVTFKTNTGSELSLTAGHYIYVNGERVPAKAMKTGDVVQLGDGSFSNVVSIKTVKGRGLFNPQTTHGDIIVDGVRASTYTTAVAPKAAHALLAPVRSLYERFGLTTGYLDAGSARLAALVGQVVSN